MNKNSVVTGFYKDAGLFIECPNCHTSLSFGIASIFQAINQNKNYECEKCKKYLSMSLLVQVLNDEEDEKENGWDNE